MGLVLLRLGLRVGMLSLKGNWVLIVIGAGLVIGWGVTLLIDLNASFWALDLAHLYRTSS